MATMFAATFGQNSRQTNESPAMGTSLFRLRHRFLLLTSKFSWLECRFVCRFAGGETKVKFVARVGSRTSRKKKTASSQRKMKSKLARRAWHQRHLAQCIFTWLVN